MTTPSLDQERLARALPGLLQAATSKGVSGAYGQAVTMTRAIVKLAPDHAPAWYLLGVLYGQQGQAFASALALRQCLRLAPDTAHAHLAVGELALRCDAPRAALEHLERAVAGAGALTQKQGLWAALLRKRACELVN